MPEDTFVHDMAKVITNVNILAKMELTHFTSGDNMILYNIFEEI